MLPRPPAHGPARRWAPAALAGLVAGVLTLAPSGTASAATPLPTDTVGYVCSGAFGRLPVSVSVSLTNVADGAPTGLRLPSGLALDVSVDLPTGLFGGLLGGLGGGLGGGDVRGNLSGLSLSFGSDELPLGDLVDDVDDATSDPVLDTEASTDAFELPSPGDYDLSLPESFTFSPLSFLGVSLLTLRCDLVGDDAVVDEIEVDEQDSTTDVEVEDPDAAVPVLDARVVRELGRAGSGKVVTKVGSRVVHRATLRRGAARIPLKGLAPGRHRVTVTYLGDRTTAPSTRTVRVVVPR